MQGSARVARLNARPYRLMLVRTVATDAEKDNNLSSHETERAKAERNHLNRVGP